MKKLTIAMAIMLSSFGASACSITDSMGCVADQNEYREQQEREYRLQQLEQQQAQLEYEMRQREYQQQQPQRQAERDAACGNTDTGVKLLGCALTVFGQ